MAAQQNEQKWYKRWYIKWPALILSICWMVALVLALIWGATRLFSGGGKSDAERIQELREKIAMKEEILRLQKENDDCRGKKKSKLGKPPNRQHREAKPFQHRFDPDLVPLPDRESSPVNVVVNVTNTMPAPAPQAAPPAPIIIEKERVKIQTRVVREEVEDEPEVEVRRVRRSAPVVIFQDDYRGYYQPPLVGWGRPCPPRRWHHRQQTWSGGGGNWGGPHGVGTPGPIGSGGGPHGVGTPGPIGGGGSPHGVGTPGPHGVGTPGGRGRR